MNMRPGKLFCIFYIYSAIQNEHDYLTHNYSFCLLFNKQPQFFFGLFLHDFWVRCQPELLWFPTKPRPTSLYNTKPELGMNMICFQFSTLLRTHAKRHQTEIFIILDLKVSNRQSKIVVPSIKYEA